MCIRDRASGACLAIARCTLILQTLHVAGLGDAVQSFLATQVRDVDGRIAAECCVDRLAQTQLVRVRHAIGLRELAGDDAEFGVVVGQVGIGTLLRLRAGVLAGGGCDGFERDAGVSFAGLEVGDQGIERGIDALSLCLLYTSRCV